MDEQAVQIVAKIWGKRQRVTVMVYGREDEAYVLAWDDVTQHWTRCHGLTRRAVRQAKEKAGMLGGW